MINSLLCNSFNKIVSLAGYNIDIKTANKLLVSHPSYPSIESINETLLYLNIPNEVYVADYDYLRNLHDKYSIVHMNIEGGLFFVILEINDNHVKVYNPRKNTIQTLAKNVFINLWSDVALSISAISITKLSYKNNVTQKLYLSLLFCALAIITLLPFIFLDSLKFTYLIPVYVNLLGVLITYFIVTHELHLNSGVVNSVCHRGAKIDCDAVLNSPASKLFGVISLGDIGIVYFTGGFVYCLILPLLTEVELYVQSAFYLSVCTLPYTVYSLYSQWLVIKRWCLFCICVLTLLWGITLSYGLLIENIHPVNIKTIYFMMLCFGGTTIFWILLKSFIKQKAKLLKESINLLTLKRNHTIISTLMSRQQTFDMDFSEDEIILGDKSSSLTITTVISEDCGHCKKIASIITHLDHISFKWIVRFDGLIDEKWLKNNFDFPIYLFSLRDLDDEIIIKAIKEWSVSKNSDWINKHIKNIDKEYINGTLIDNLKWIEKNKIDKMPTIFVNNRLLPSIYTIQDITILISNDDTLKLLSELQD